ncbi:MAG TPA: iron ABC transporter permease [Spirochaetales bacterium]|nr:iron ABC transporter permease [Spirochaetales bacterium]
MTDSPVPGFGLREGTARRRAGFVLLGVAGALLFGADLAFGSVGIPFAEAVKALFGAASDPAWNDIVRIFRLPKALTAASAGAALALAGLILQTIFRNPLAGPDSLGIGAGASVGVGVVVLLAGGSSGATLLTGLGLAGWAGLAAAAAVGSLAVLLLILAAARRVENGVTLLIVGLLVGYLAGALVSLMVWFGSPQKTQVFLGWTYGSFSGVTLERLPVLLGAVGLGAALTGRSAKPLDALLLGERYAESVGIRVRPARARVLVAASILAGAVTAFCGPIAFLGIAAPQAARRIFRSSAHRVLMPASALLGAVFALTADVVAQTPGGGSVLPVNPILALIGAPIVLSVFLRGARGKDPA